MLVHSTFISRFIYTPIRRYAAVDPSIVECDIIYLSVRAGHGGNGLQKYNGVGGNGASIYIRPTKNSLFSELCDLFREKKKIIKGKPGTESMQRKLAGASAEPFILNVPLGVECVNAETRMLVARCTNSGMEYLIAKGGDGGSHLNSYKGQKGTHLQLAIHFKLTTNIGFVGLPNAGKSTLLKAMAPERQVKIADYPFTTIRPQVLSIAFEEKVPDLQQKVPYQKDPAELFSLSVADLPGIIEGASRNRGRGHAFLKHLEHSEIIIMIVDVHGFKLSDSYNELSRDALQSVAILNQEMEAFDINLVKKPMVLVFNKIDLNNGKEIADKICDHFAQTGDDWYKQLPDGIQPKQPIKFISVLSLSAKSGEIDELKSTLRQLYDDIHPVGPVEGLDEEFDEKFGKYMV